MRSSANTASVAIAEDIGKPEVMEGVGFVKYVWPDLGLRVMVERLTDEGVCELSVFSGNGSDELIWLPPQKVNLLSTPGINHVGKRLFRNSQEISWDDVLAYVIQETLKIARRGEPAIEIWPDEQDTLEAEYLLKPLLYRNHPTVIFGDYGSVKSLGSLAIAYIVQLPYHDNNLGLITGMESTICLYLDYEDDPSSFRKRWSALERGFGKGAMPILYRRMTTTLADSVDQLRRIIDDTNIRLLLIDSLGPAARGNLNDPEPAIKYHTALRQLGITSLTLAHTAKDQLTKNRTIFGSVFFTNLARSVWECKAEQEIGEDEAVISLKNTKANLSRRHPPLGLRFTFTDNSISVAKTDLKDTDLSGELPLSWQIKNLLRTGSFAVNEIAEKLDSKADTVGRTLRRMRGKNQIIKLEDDTWGLRL